MLKTDEIVRTIEMLKNENLDLRTVTLGISLLREGYREGKKAQSERSTLSPIGPNSVTWVLQRQTGYSVPSVREGEQCPDP